MHNSIRSYDVAYAHLCLALLPLSTTGPGIPSILIRTPVKPNVAMTAPVPVQYVRPLALRHICMPRRVRLVPDLIVPVLTGNACICGKTCRGVHAISACKLTKAPLVLCTAPQDPAAAARTVAILHAGLHLRRT